MSRDVQILESASTRAATGAWGTMGFVRFAELPGAEVLDVRHVARKWSYFHETYSFCVASWVEDPRDIAWRYRQRTHQMNPAGVQLMEPGELHSNMVEAPCADFRVLMLSPDLVQRVCRDLGAPDRPPHLKVAQLYRGRVQRVLSQLTSLLVDHHDTERADLGLYRLMEALWQQDYLETSSSHALRERGRRAVFVVRDLIHASWNRHLPISSLIQEAKLPLATLERSFSQMFGLSPRQYQLRLRLGRARELFKHGDAPVADVAQRCGFNDPKYFSRLFKRELGCQPTDYKRAIVPGR